MINEVFLCGVITGMLFTGLLWRWHVRMIVDDIARLNKPPIG